MIFNTEKIEKYGTMVHVHPEMDDLRRTHCLCLNCANMADCEIAHSGYEICKKYNVAYAMTRCPEFVGK